jgi:hypothetical protein
MNGRVLLLLAGIAIGVAGCGQPVKNTTSENQPASGPAAGSGAKVTVTASEWKIAVSPASVPAGNVTLVLSNTGKEPHGIYIDGPGTDRKAPLMQPGGTTEITLTVPAGEFNLTDFVKDNEFAHNMKATFAAK